MNNLTITGLRLLAIWFFMQAFGYIQFVPLYFSDQYQNLNAGGIGSLIVFLIYVIFAAILFFKAPAIAERINGNRDENSFQINNYQKLAAILFATVGLFIFSFALESLTRNIGTIYSSRAMSSHASNSLMRDIRILLFGGGIQMMVGAGLFVGGKKLANWWYDFRNWT